MDKERLTYYTALVSSPLLRQNGIIFPRFNIIVTPYSSIKTCKETVVRTESLPNQMARAVFFDPKHKLAYYRLQFQAGISTDLGESPELPLVGQPAVIFSRTYAKGIKETNSYFSKIYENKGVNFLQVQSKLPPVFLGSLVTDTSYTPVGMVIGYDTNERMQVLPIKYILEGIYELQEFSEEFAFRCPYCDTILTEDNVAFGKCAFCGGMLPQELYKGAKYIPDKNEAKIEQILKLLNVDYQTSRLDQYYWEIPKHSSKIIIHYDKKQKALVAYSKIGEQEEAGITESSRLMTTLLEENNNLKHLTISLNDKEIFISTFYLNADYLVPEKAVEIIRDLIAESDRIKQKIQNNE